MKKQRVLALLLSAAMVMGALTGCGNSNGDAPAESGTEAPAESEAPAQDSGEETADAAENKDVVTIKIYNMIPEQADQQSVMDEVNKYTREKIGVEVDYVMSSSFTDKIQTVIASGEEYDACFTSNWLNGYNTNVAKGAFVDITDMLPEVAPKLYETLPEYMWDAAKVNGRIYAVPNQQIVARQIGALMPKEYLDAAGAKVEDMKTLTDLTDYAQYAFDNYGAKVGGVTVSQAADYCGYELISDNLSCGAVKYGDESATVVNLYETDEWISMLNELVALNEKGLLDGQCGYDPEYGETQRVGKKCSALFSGTYKPGVEAEESLRAGFECVMSKGQSEPIITTNSVIATMYGISSTSKHPEETLKFLELVSTDPYLMNLLTYGIEGKHYTKVSDNVVAPIENSGYSHGQSWAIGNVFNSYVTEGQPEDVWEQTKALNDSAQASTLLGFSFDPEPVKMEITNISKVVKEYENLVGGERDVDSTNAEFVEKLKAAGLDAVLAEMQKQVDAFMETK